MAVTHPILPFRNVYSHPLENELNLLKIREKEILLLWFLPPIYVADLPPDEIRQNT